jgi:phage terminase large subunit
MAEKPEIKLTDKEAVLLIEQLKRETVAPKFDQWRKPFRYKIAYGGRGAGAKTWSAFSLAVQFAETPGYFGEQCNVLCTREVQLSIKQSSWTVVRNTVVRLGYKGWKITENYIQNTKNGSTFVFKGMNDLAADNFKSFENFNILLVEEASGIGYIAWESVLPTFRKKGSEIWALFNRDKELDPVYDIFVKNERPNSCVLHLLPGIADNPWFNDGELPAERDADYERDPDSAAHIWEGLPRSQGENSIIKRVLARSAVNRIANTDGVEEIGVDVARYGGDSSQMYRRKGMAITGHKEKRMCDTIELANEVWAFAGNRKDIRIKIDAGYNPGVIDVLKNWGANVIEVEFGSCASDKDLYANAVSEMWFTLPINEISIPDDDELITQLTDRRYKYDKAGRKQVEAKDEYKKRNSGLSPDKADALLLTFYQGKNNLVSEKIREDMRLLRSR